MGYSITWFAIPEAQADSFLQSLGLASTGQTEEFPESLISAARMDTGWRVLWYNRYTCPFLRDSDLTEKSAEHDILVCTVEEHVMASSAALWSKGSCQWTMSHDGSSGSKGLKLAGEPPACFAAIKEDMERQQRQEDGGQREVDYIFEIPLKVAESLTGFKHDEECTHLAEGHFVVMTRVNDESDSASARKPGFLRRLFGGK